MLKQACREITVAIEPECILLKDRMSLKQKAVSGIIWTFAQQFSVQAINVVIGLVLARILLPSEFGLIGMMAIFVAIGTTLMDSGMTMSLIRTNNPDNDDYSTVFFINLIFSIIIFGILFFVSPFVAEFYNQPILKPLMRVYTLAFVIRALVGVQTTKLSKELRFKEQMLMQIPSTIIGGISGVYLAKNGYGVWSLVWMNLIQASLFAIQHWIFSGWYPNLKINKAKFKHHIGFGYKLTFSGLIDTIYTNAYNVTIGKLFSPSQVGYYTQANNLQSLPVENISRALSKVTFPMFATIQDDTAKLKSAYRKLLHQVIFGVAPMMVLGILVAKPLFLLLLSPRWEPAVPYFQILCITGILHPFHVYNLNILNIRGRSDLFLKLEIIKKAFITVGIITSLYWGIYGLLIFRVIDSIFAFWVNTIYSGKFIDYPGVQQIREVLPCIGISFFTGLVLYIFNMYVLAAFHLPNIVVLLILSVLFGGIYLGLCKLYKIEALNELKQLILKR